VIIFVDGSSHTSVLSETASLSAAVNRPTDSDDSFFSAWLASEQHDARQSPSDTKSALQNRTSLPA